MAKLLILPDLPICVTARGEWLHGDTPLHPRVAKLFARHVVPLADGGYEVRLGPMTHQRLEVADTAFFVLSITQHVEAGRLTGVTLTLSDAATEALDPTTLRQSAANVLYCDVQRHGMRVPCRFTAAQYHALALHAEMDGDVGYLPIGHERYKIAPKD